MAMGGDNIDCAVDAKPLCHNGDQKKPNVLALFCILHHLIFALLLCRDTRGLKAHAM